MTTQRDALVTIQPRQTASGRWAVRTVVEADGQRTEFDTAEGLNEADAMTNAVKLSEALRALGGPVKLLGAQDDPA